MNKSKIWLFRCLSVLICAVMVIGPIESGAALKAVAQPMTDDQLPGLSASVSQQLNTAPMVSQPLTSTVLNSGTSLDGSTDAATIDALLAPSAPEACTSLMSAATLARRDDIVAINRNNQTQFRQPNYAWGSWSANMTTGLSNTPAAVAHNRIIDWIVNKSGTMYHGRTLPDQTSLPIYLADGQFCKHSGYPDWRHFLGRSLARRTNGL